MVSQHDCTFDLVNWLWTVSTLAIDFLTDPILDSFAGAPPVTCATRSLFEMMHNKKLESHIVFLCVLKYIRNFLHQQVESRCHVIYRGKLLFQLLQLSEEFSLTLGSKLMCLNFSCDFRENFDVNRGILHSYFDGLFGNR